LATVPAPANRRDDGLVAATLDAVALVGPPPQRPVVHLDAGDDFQPCRQVLARGAWPAGSPPVQANAGPGGRSLAGGAHPRVGNQCGKLRWSIQRRRVVVEFWLALSGAAIVCGRLIRRAWTCYRWGQPARRHPMTAYRRTPQGRRCCESAARER
jgi:hypothetical protein